MALEKFTSVDSRSTQKVDGHVHVKIMTGIVQGAPYRLSLPDIHTFVSLSPLACRQDLWHTSSQGNEAKVIEVSPRTRCSVTKLFLGLCYIYVYSPQRGSP